MSILTCVCKGYPTYGFSTAVDPWGKVIDKLDENEGILLFDIDLSRIQDKRDNIPTSKQKRHDLYNSPKSKL